MCVTCESLGFYCYLSMQIKVIFSLFQIKMGGQSSQIPPKKEINLLIVGPETFGKGSIMHKLEFGEASIKASDPTIHIQMDVYRGVSEDGENQQENSRNIDGVIIVVNCQDEEHVRITDHKLKSLLSKDELEGAVLLIFANNKQSPKADVRALTKKLHLYDFRGHVWYLVSTCDAEGSNGLYQGLNWLSKALSSKMSSI